MAGCPPGPAGLTSQCPACPAVVWHLCAAESVGFLEPEEQGERAKGTGLLSGKLGRVLLNPCGIDLHPLLHT